VSTLNDYVVAAVKGAWNPYDRTRLAAAMLVADVPVLIHEDMAIVCRGTTAHVYPFDGLAAGIPVSPREVERAVVEMPLAVAAFEQAFLDVFGDDEDMEVIRPDGTTPQVADAVTDALDTHDAYAYDPDQQPGTLDVLPRGVNPRGGDQ
jgi:hypothetical protein